MLFHVSCALEYAARFPSTLILNVHAQRSPSQTVLEETFAVEPPVKVSEFSSEGSDNRFVRLETGAHEILKVEYRAAVDCDIQTYAARSIEATPVSELSGSTISVFITLGDAKEE